MRTQAQERGWIVEAWHPTKPQEPVAVTQIGALTIEEAHDKVRKMAEKMGFDGAFIIHPVH